MNKWTFKINAEAFISTASILLNLQAYARMAVYPLPPEVQGTTERVIVC